MSTITCNTRLTDSLERNLVRNEMGRNVQASILPPAKGILTSFISYVLDVNDAMTEARSEQTQLTAA
ncbi:MAG TPA: hypothetical protein VIP51_03750 [Eoetvoesiella sp.]